MAYKHTTDPETFERLTGHGGRSDQLHRAVENLCRATQTDTPELTEPESAPSVAAGEGTASAVDEPVRSDAAEAPHADKSDISDLASRATEAASSAAEMDYFRSSLL